MKVNAHNAIHNAPQFAGLFGLRVVLAGLLFSCCFLYSKGQCYEFKSQLTVFQEEIQSLKSSVQSARTSAHNAVESRNGKEAEWALTKLKRAEKHVNLAVENFPVASLQGCNCPGWDEGGFRRTLGELKDEIFRLRKSNISTQSDWEVLDSRLQRLRSKVNKFRRSVNTSCESDSKSTKDALLAENESSRTTDPLSEVKPDQNEPATSIAANSAPVAAPAVATTTVVTKDIPQNQPASKASDQTEKPESEVSSEPQKKEPEAPKKSEDQITPTSTKELEVEETVETSSGSGKPEVGSTSAPTVNSSGASVAAAAAVRNEESEGQNSDDQTEQEPGSTSNLKEIEEPKQEIDVQEKEPTSSQPQQKKSDSKPTPSKSGSGKSGSSGISIPTPSVSGGSAGKGIAAGVAAGAAVGAGAAAASSNKPSTTENKPKQNSELEPEPVRNNSEIANEPPVNREPVSAPYNSKATPSQTTTSDAAVSETVSAPEVKNSAEANKASTPQPASPNTSSSGIGTSVGVGVAAAAGAGSVAVAAASRNREKPNEVQESDNSSRNEATSPEPEARSGVTSEETNAETFAPKTTEASEKPIQSKSNVVPAVAPSTASAPATRNGGYYAIQIGAFGSDKTQSHFQDFPYPVYAVSESGLFKHRVGSYKTKEEALKTQQDLAAKGYPSTFIVTVGNPAPPINKPTANAGSKQEAISVQKVSTDEPSAPSDPYYSVQVLSSDRDLSKMKFKGLSYKVYVVKEGGLFKHRIGKYRTVTEAIQVKNMVANQGVKDAFVVAIYKGRRISIAEAREKVVTQQPTNPAPVADQTPKPSAGSSTKAAAQLSVFVAVQLQALSSSRGAQDKMARFENELGQPIDQFRQGNKILLIAGQTKSTNRAEANFNSIKNKFPQAKLIGIANDKVVDFRDAKAHLERKK